jgi:hypothetical protein
LARRSESAARPAGVGWHGRRPHLGPVRLLEVRDLARTRLGRKRRWWWWRGRLLWRRTGGTLGAGGPRRAPAPDELTHAADSRGRDERPACPSSRTHSTCSRSRSTHSGSIRPCCSA